MCSQQLWPLLLHLWIHLFPFSINMTQKSKCICLLVLSEEINGVDIHSKVEWREAGFALSIRSEAGTVWLVSDNPQPCQRLPPKGAREAVTPRAAQQLVFATSWALLFPPFTPGFTPSIRERERGEGRGKDGQRRERSLNLISFFLFLLSMTTSKLQLTLLNQPPTYHWGSSIYILCKKFPEFQTLHNRRNYVQLESC